MRKALSIFVVLSVFSLSAFGQSIKPLRISVGMDGAYAGEVAYAFPIGTTSLALSGGVALGDGFGWLGQFSFYPFSKEAKGWCGSLGIRSTEDTDIFVSAGYHFLFWDWLSLRLAFTVGYNLNGRIYPGTGSSFSYPPTLMLGVAF